MLLELLVFELLLLGLLVFGAVVLVVYLFAARLALVVAYCRWIGGSGFTVVIPVGFTRRPDEVVVVGIEPFISLLLELIPAPTDCWHARLRRLFEADIEEEVFLRRLFEDELEGEDFLRRLLELDVLDLLSKLFVANVDGD